jgi:hypothetical protein
MIVDEGFLNSSTQAVKLLQLLPKMLFFNPTTIEKRRYLPGTISRLLERLFFGSLPIFYLRGTIDPAFGYALIACFRLYATMPFVYFIPHLVYILKNNIP